MALNTLLIIAAGLGGGLGQEPSIDTQIATPVSNRAANPAYSAPLDSADKISVHFHDAKPSEVLDFLEKQGINFMVSKGEISDDTRVTINVDNQPVDDVLNALARALGGHWEKENGVRVYRKGGGAWYDGSTSAPFTRFMPQMPMTKDGKPLTADQWDKTFGKDFQKKMEMFSKDMQGKFSPDMMKNFPGDGDVRIYKWDDGALKQLQGDGKLSKEQIEKIKKQYADGHIQGEKMRIEIEKQLKDGDKDHSFKFFTDNDGKMNVFGDKDHQFKVFTDKDGKVNVFGDKGGQFKVFTDKDGKVNVFGDKDHQFKVFTDKDGKVNVFGDSSPDFKVFTNKDGAVKFFGDKDHPFKVFTDKDGKVEFRDKDGKTRIFTLPKDGGFFPGTDRSKVWTAPGFKSFADGKGYKFQSLGFGNGIDVKKFMDTLTDDQQDKQRKRGYIRYSDLTQDQKALLGKKPDGKFEITFKVDGDQITVRND